MSTPNVSTAGKRVAASPVAVVPAGQLALPGKLVICSDIPYPPQEFFDDKGKSLTADVMKTPPDVSGLFVVEREMKDSSGKPVGRIKAGFRDDTRRW